MRFVFGGRGVFDPNEADESGLVAVGGALTTELIVEAYSSGVFPWSSDPVLSWWSPDPRAIFDLDTWRAHRSVKKHVRQAGWRFSIDEDFAGVIRSCAEPTADRPSTWLSPDFVSAYTHLHRIGMAHSVEVWEGEALVGGLYGVQLGGLFIGESMFHRRPDASKGAIGHLVERCRAGGITLLDGQAPNEHLTNLGAVDIPRAEYLRRLEDALSRQAVIR